MHPIETNRSLRPSHLINIRSSHAFASIPANLNGQVARLHAVIAVAVAVGIVLDAGLAYEWETGSAS